MGYTDKAQSCENKIFLFHRYPLIEAWYLVILGKEMSESYISSKGILTIITKRKVTNNLNRQVDNKCYYFPCACCCPYCCLSIEIVCTDVYKNVKKMTSDLCIHMQHKSCSLTSIVNILESLYISFLYFQMVSFLLEKCTLLYQA